MNQNEQQNSVNDQQFQVNQSQVSNSINNQNVSQENQEEQQTVYDVINLENKNQFHQSVFEEDSSYQFENKEFDFQSIGIYSTRFDPTGGFIASGCEDGIIRIISQHTQNITYNLHDLMEKSSPVTCVRWRPSIPQENLKNTLLATYGNGSVLFWHATSNQILVRINGDPNNPLNCCDYSFEGLRFVTGGQDCRIRVYDAGRSKPIATHTEPSVLAPAHTNRIFALKHHNSEPFTLFSAGWDKQVILWDLRTRLSQQYIYGPSVYGDGLDQMGNYLLTGSYREDNQIEMWDIRTLKKVTAIKWEEYGIQHLKHLDSQQINYTKQRTCLYSCCFDKTGNFIYAGSVGTVFSEIRAFNVDENFRCWDSYCVPSPRGILSIDCMGRRDKKLTYGLADGRQGILNIKQ